MGRVAPNQALAVEVIDRLRAAGVRTFCLCPGGRNAPLVEALDALASLDVEVLDFYEERSASFFALGRARRDGHPVAVLTTSGTAAAELLPAMVEAHYACIPLIAVTADRPREYRGTAAPQTIEQVGLFGVYARQSVDLDRPGEAWALEPVDGPSHVNVCFDEPLLAGWQPLPAVGATRRERGGATLAGHVGATSLPAATGEDAETWRRARQALHGCTRPLVLLGALPRADDRHDALAFCQRLGAPVLAEASSGLKAVLGGLLLTAGEAAAQRGFVTHGFDSVVLLGDIPSFRLWRDLESTWLVPVVSFSRKPWAGVTHGVHVRLRTTDSLAAALPPLPAFPAPVRSSLAAFDAQVAALTDCLLAEFPEGEPACVRRVSQHVPSGSFLYLGNSQPIREWNQFALFEERDWIYGENRGANGIDGQLSAFLGGAMGDRENWAVVGDLTALYDLSSPWALRHVTAAVRLVVINNGGGRIFERMFANPRFQNRHRVTFEGFAALWGLEYRTALPVTQAGGALVVELRPDEEQTDAFWKALRSGIASIRP